jgi:hypothetical protein
VLIDRVVAVVSAGVVMAAVSVFLVSRPKPTTGYRQETRGDETVDTALIAYYSEAIRYI